MLLVSECVCMCVILILVYIMCVFPCVCNLSEKGANLMSNGLSFAPNPNIDETSIVDATVKMDRKLNYVLGVAVTTILKTVRH